MRWKSRPALAARRAAAAWACALALGVTANADPEPYSEYEIKAAYLLNFTRYVEWPASTFDSADAPIVIAVVGSNPFDGQLDRVVLGRTSNHRSIRVTYSDDPDGIGRCHILFVSKEAQQRFDWRLLAWDQPVLTVGETRDFLDDGGGINLFFRRGTIRFGVNLEATERAGLKVSSRMLKTADQVIWPRGGRR